MPAPSRLEAADMNRARPEKLIAAVAAAAACLAAPAAAQAHSIAYAKDHDSWIADPDGAGQHRVTTDGVSSASSSRSRS